MARTPWWTSLGWGNRMLVGEGVLFAGLDVPFSLTGAAGFAPMWGPTTHDVRSGVVHREGRVASTLMSMLLTATWQR